MKIPKNRVIENSVIIAEQAESLSGRSLLASEGSTLGSEENPLREASKALEADYIKPISKPKKFRPGTIADPTPINEMFTETKLDLDVLYRTNRAISSVIENLYNTIAVKEDDIVGKFKTLRDKIASLKLYATEITDDDQYIVFTFTDGTRIKVPESSSIASYNEAEGALTLPIESIESINIKAIKIVEGSNGTPGNNFERSRSRNVDLNFIKDGTPYTWFEYEKISDERGGELKLILRLEFEEPTIINRISINPANLGTSNWIDIKDIQVQIDQRFVSIKDDVESAAWLSDDNFKLAPASSKFAGQGIFTFKPRLASSVQIVLTQNESYPILNGRFARYAIALREVEVSKVTFSDEGEFLLEDNSFQRPVRAIGIMQNLNPYDIDLASTEFFISTDGGEEWKSIVALENKDSAKTEALLLKTPSKNLMVKGKIKRSSEGFNRLISQDDSLLEDKGKVIPTSSISGAITLDTKPESFLELIETRYGCQGIYGNNYFLGKSNGIVGTPQTFELPIQLDKEDFALLVNNEEWQRSNGFTSENDKKFVYDFNGSNKNIIFGDGIAIDQGGMGGAVPTAGAEIYLKIYSLENPDIEEEESFFRILLKYQASKIRESAEVIVRDLEAKEGISTSGPGTSYIDIPWERSMTVLLGLETPEYDYFESATKVDFQNGEIEFTNLNAGTYYSIDYENNRIWLSSPTSNTSGDITARYKYILREKVSKSLWKFSKIHNSIEINKDILNERTSSKEVEERLNSRTLDIDGSFLADKSFSIIKGSIKGIDLNGQIGISRTLQTEVNFINGSEEFESIRIANSSLLGYFSVDYDKNKIYLPRFDNIDAADQGFLPGKITFRYVSLEVHYDLGRKLEENKEYTVSNKLIEPTPFYLDRIENITRRLQRRIDLHIRYDVEQTSQIEGNTLKPYYSPVLRDLAIIGIGVNPRLGTLESL